MGKYLQGMRTSANINQDRQVRDVAGKIFYLTPYLSPLLLLLQKGTWVKQADGKRRLLRHTRFVSSSKYEHFENAYKDPSTKLTAAYAADATEITVPDASIFVPNDIIQNVNKDEYMMVTASDVQTNKITVIRDYVNAHTSDPAGEVGDTLLNVGSAFQQGAGKPTAVSTKPESGYNYLQDFRNGISLSDIEAGENLYGEDEETRLLREARYEHVKSMERAFLFGERSLISDPVTGKHITTTRGLLKSVLTFNSDIPDANFNASNFEEWLVDEAFKYRMPETGLRKIMLAGSDYLKRIDAFGKDTNYRTNLTPGENTYGLFCGEYSTRKGKVKIVEHPYLTDYYSSSAVVVDLNAMFYVAWRSKKTGSLDTKMYKHIQNNDVTAFESYFRSYVGFQMVNEATCARSNIV